MLRVARLRAVRHLVLSLVACVAVGACSSEAGDSGADGDAGASVDGGTGPETSEGGAGPDVSDGGGGPDASDGGVDADASDGGVDADASGGPPVDTDCDGLSDEVELTTPRAGGAFTDPNNPDTDGDGLPDGLELGITTPVPGTNCTIVADADPLTKTNPLAADTDGDGIEDGVEDANHDGRVDLGESDPNVADVGTVANACAAPKRRTLSAHTVQNTLTLALPSGVAPVAVVDAATALGYAALDASGAGLATLTRTPGAGVADALGLEESVRPILATAGALTNRVARRFKTWEGDDALVVTYDQTSARGVAAQTNALIAALAPASTGRLSEPQGAPAGNARMSALFVHRAAGPSVVALGVAPLADTGAASVAARDFVGGAALRLRAQTLAAECESFEPKSAKVDILLVVDDSSSMAAAQTALADATLSMTNVLASSQVDWRIGGVTTSYMSSNSTNSAKLRAFTRNASTVRAWLTQNSTCSSGACTFVPGSTCPGDSSQGSSGGCGMGLVGNGTETLLGSARKALNDITPGTAAGDPESAVLARADASLVVVLVGDADDQTTGDSTSATNCGINGSLDAAGSDCVPVSTFTSFFVGAGAQAPGNKTGRPVVVHGVVCPSGEVCGCTSGACNLTNASREFNPQPVNGVSRLRHAAVVNATGGVLGSIQSAASVSRTIDAITLDMVGRFGRPLRGANAIGASVRVAVSSVANPAACDASDVPRSTSNGFDIDATRGTLSLFGACRPAPGGTAAASFTHWTQ